MSNYQTAFPGLTPADMPAIPADWQDMSWHNDACPSFAFMIGGEGDSNHKLARAWVDFADPADREHSNGPRFSVTFEGGAGDVFDALATDDWAEVLAYVESRKALGAAYVAAIGYNPFLDDPAIDPAEVAATLRQLTASHVLHLSIEEVDTVAFALRHAGTVAIESGEGSAATVRAYVEGINALLAQIEAEPVTIPADL